MYSISGQHFGFGSILGVVQIVPTEGALVYLNGKTVSQSHPISTGSRVILGKHHVFRFNHPAQGLRI